MKHNGLATLFLAYLALLTPARGAVPFSGTDHLKGMPTNFLFLDLGAYNPLVGAGIDVYLPGLFPRLQVGANVSYGAGYALDSPVLGGAGLSARAHVGLILSEGKVADSYRWTLDYSSDGVYETTTYLPIEGPTIRTTSIVGELSLEPHGQWSDGDGEATWESGYMLYLTAKLRRQSVWWFDYQVKEETRGYKGFVYWDIGPMASIDAARIGGVLEARLLGDFDGFMRLGALYLFRNPKGRDEGLDRWIFILSAGFNLMDLNLNLGAADAGW